MTLEQLVERIVGAMLDRGLEHFSAPIQGSGDWSAAAMALTRAQALAALTVIDESGYAIVRKEVTPRDAIPYLMEAFPRRVECVRCDADVEAERRGLEAWVKSSALVVSAEVEE